MAKADDRVTGGQTSCPPWGLARGKAAAVDAVIVNPDTPEAESIKKVNHKPVKASSRISVRGGGGDSNPFERAPELVRLDIVRGYVSREAAQREYGVVLQPDMLAIALEETQRLRPEVGSWGDGQRIERG